jgi:hypothetical protein
MGLSFLSPLFLIGLLGVAIPIALHLFRRESGPVVPFSAVRFLQRAPVQQTHRRRLHDLLLLALRVAALTLLALSFARPYLAAGKGPTSAGVTIVAVDRSFSMSGPGQFARARELALGVIDDIPRGDRVAVIAFDDRAEVLAAPSVDRTAARQAITTLTPGYGITRYAGVLSSAAELARGTRARLVVVSDLQRHGWSAEPLAAVPDDLVIETREIASPPENLAVSDVRRSAEGAVVEIRSSGAAPRRARITLAVDGRMLASQDVTIEPSAARHVTFASKLPARGALRAEVTDRSGYTTDNVRFAVLDPAQRQRLLIVVSPGEGSDDGLYVSKAIGATEGDSGLTVDTLTADRLSARPDVLNAYAAVALLGSVGFDRRAGMAVSAALERGCGLLIAAGPATEWAWLAGQLPSELDLRSGREEALSTPVSFAPTDLRHPVFRSFRNDSGWLSNVRFSRVVRIGRSNRSTAIARFGNGLPALLEIEGTRGRMLLFTSDLASHWNDFSLHAAFVPFVHDVVRYLVAGRPPASQVHVGARPGPQWSEPGVVVDSNGGARVAVNVDLRESDRSQMTPAAFGAAVPRARSVERPLVSREARAQESNQSWWRYGLMLMLAGLVAESVVGRRG